MAFYPSATISRLEEKARIFYLDQTRTRGWNETRRRDNELRLVTGWTWQERLPRDSKAAPRSRTGFKTYSAAARDAFYILIENREQPADVSRLRVPALVAAE